MKKFKLFVFALISFLLMGFSVNAASNEAKIGSKEYATILEAIEAAKSNDEIIILKDLDLTAYPSDYDHYIQFVDNVTVNLNGNSIKTNNNAITYRGNDLTIKNGEFVINGYGTEKEGSYGLFIGGGATSGYVLEDLVVKGGINVRNATDVVLKDVTATGTNYYAVWADYDTELTIESGVYSSKSGIILNVTNVVNTMESSMTVKGGTFAGFIPNEYLANDANITVKLEEDLNLKKVVDINGNVTLDLNGHDIIQTTEKTNVFNVLKGNLNITGKGNIVSGTGASNAIRIYGSKNVADKDYTNVTIGKDVTVESDGYGAFITINNNRAYGVEVNIYGTLKGGYNGFFVNGTIQDVDKNGFKNFPVVNIYDSANIEGIYAGGYATWNIGAANIQDKEFGIGLKAGKFNIDGAVISATGEKKEPQGHSNGINPTGSAIQVETSKDYADHIEINIKDATVTSKNGYAFLEYLGETAILSLSIENGKFTSANGLEILNTTENFGLTKFIKGGTYSADVVKDYLAAGLTTRKVENNYVVGTERTVNIGKVSGGFVSVDVTKAFDGDEVTITLKPEEGYLLESVKVVDADNKEVEVKDNKFVMPDSNVTVSAEFLKVTQSTEIPVVGETNEIGVKDAAKTEEVLLETLGASTDEKVKEALKDKNVKVEVEIEDVKANESLTTDFEKVLTDEKLNNAKVVNFFDITVAVKNANTGEEITTLPELSKAIELMVKLPELEAVKEGYVREYYIIREHNGKVELIKDVTLSEDGKHLLFESKEFSTYALAYNDVLEEKTPETGDSILYFVGLGFMSIAAVGLALNNLKKRTNR